MRIQPSSSGAERKAAAFSALTGWAAGFTGMGSSSSSGTVRGASPLSSPGTKGVWVAAGAMSCGATARSWAGAPSAGFTKKSSAGVSTASGTTGLTMARGAARRSGSMPKVPPGPRSRGSMGSLPPSFTGVWSGPRSMSKEARGPAGANCTGSKSGRGWWPGSCAGSGGGGGS